MHRFERECRHLGTPRVDDSSVKSTDTVSLRHHKTNAVLSELK